MIEGEGGGEGEEGGGGEGEGGRGGGGGERGNKDTVAATQPEDVLIKVRNSSPPLSLSHSKQHILGSIGCSSPCQPVCTFWCGSKHFQQGHNSRPPSQDPQ